MSITILIKSSSQSEPRSVQVTQDESGLSFLCDCPAGIRGRICKHKRALVSADESMLYDENQKDSFQKIMDWVNASSYPDLMKALKAAENDLELANGRARDIKETVTRAMKEGLK